MNPQPTAEELACIAINTADSAKKLLAGFPASA
jgi:phosphotransacetylase